MNKLDRMIEEALAEEDRTIVAETQELGYFALALGLFSGRMGWVSWVVMVVQLALFAVAIWAGWHFFTASDTLLALKWGLSSATVALMSLMMKLSLMPVMQADRVIREMKRLELMLANREPKT